MNTPRSAEVRLTEYRDTLISLADQLDTTIENLVGKTIHGRIADVTPLQDASRLYRLIANDLTKVISGEELQPFAVTGVIP